MSGDERSKGRPAGTMKALDGGFSDILNTIPDAVVSITEDQKIVFFNRGAERLFGYQSEDVLGRSIDMLIPSHLHQAHQKHVDAFIHAKQPPRYKHARGGIVGVKKSGDTFPAEASISTVEVNGETVVTAVVRDISTHMEAEVRLRTQSVAIEQAGEAILITDREGTIEYVNRAFTEITGYSAEEAIGKTPSILKSMAQDPAFYEQLWATISAGQVWSGKLIDRRKDGTFYPCKLSVSPIIGDDGHISHYVSIQTDITEQQKLEEQLLQAQRMESIGTLVGGIAHDFNNMLTGILGHAYLAKQAMDNGDEIHERMSDIERLGLQGADMIRQLLTFARKEIVEAEIIEITSLVNDTVILARIGMPDGVTLHGDICSGELYVPANVVQLQQIIMNLITNAYHAVEHVIDPEITISLDSMRCESEHMLPSGKPCVKLSVRDNGYGIAADHVDKIFEPFFTTKEVSSGTGLGLSMVYGSVTSHGGHVEVQSSGRGQGATFNVYLPLSEKNALNDEEKR